VHHKKPAKHHTKPKHHAAPQPAVAAAAGPPAEHHAQSLTDIPQIEPTPAVLQTPSAAAGASSNLGQWPVIAALVIPVVLLLIGVAVVRPVITRRRRDGAPAI
jgi:hypothetical protein